MRRALVALLLLALPGSAAAFDPAALRAHVEVLASPAMEGRLTGTAGEQAATAYVAEGFAAAGLAPAGTERWFQPFTFVDGITVLPGNRLTIQHVGAVVEPLLDRDWRPLAFAEPGGVAPTPVVFAGYGLVRAAEPAFDSYAGLDVAGAWVLVWRGVPTGASIEVRAQLSAVADLRYKAAVAKARGARGLIVAPEPGIEAPGLVPTGGVVQGGSAGLPALAIDHGLAVELLQQVEPARLQALQAGAEGPGAMLDGVTIAADLALETRRGAGRNVIGRLAAGGGALVPPLVIGAHVDHIGRGETETSLARGVDAGLIHPGADDNASGVAALIEIAAFLVKEQAAGRLEPARDILFAAWSGEEIGLLGSSAFVAAHHPPEAIAQAYLNMDMVGRLRDELTVAGVGSSPVWPDRIAAANAGLDLPTTLVESPYVPTDATPFYLAGIPVLALTTGAHAEYHTPADDAASLDYQGLARVTALVAHLARDLAMTDTALPYVALARPEAPGVSRRANVWLGTIPDYAREGERGVPISGTIAGSPAQRAGLLPGDAIVGLAGFEIATIHDFVHLLKGLRADEPIVIEVRRDGDRLPLPITPATRRTP